MSRSLRCLFIQKQIIYHWENLNEGVKMNKSPKKLFQKFN